VEPAFQCRPLAAAAREDWYAGCGETHQSAHEKKSGAEAPAFRS
jgi:hypothetical protein